MTRVLPLLLLALVGCDSDKKTFENVGPIYERHCISCHTEGGAAPFALDNYEDAAEWAGPAAAATASRTMPPYLVKDDGTCGDFEDGHWLSDFELNTIAAWAEGGAKKGKGYEMTPPEPTKLAGEPVDTTTPNFTPKIVGGDDAEFDEYRCFEIDVPGDGEVFLKGYEVIPGNEAILHHVVGMPVDMTKLGWSGERTNAEIIAELKASEPDRDGWPCFNGAGDNVRYDGEVVAWAPGQGPVNYPEDVGLQLSEGTSLVYQVHYNLADSANIGSSDQTTVRLNLADSVERRAYMFLPDLFLAGYADQSEIEPGQSETSVTFDMPIRYLTGDIPVNVELLGVLPHMHERGTSMYVSLLHEDGTETCIFEVENWDFNWQLLYMYQTRMQFTSADTIRVECVYDTSNDTEPVLPGWGTQNEMCLPSLLGAVAL